MLSRSFRMLRIAGDFVDDIDLQQGQPTRSLRRLLGEGDQTNLRSTVTSQLRLAGGHCCDRQDCGEGNVHQFDDALPSGECAPTGGVFFDKGRRCRRVGAGTVSDLVVPGGIHGCVPGGESRRASAHRREGRSGGRVCGSNGVAGAGGMAFFVGCVAVNPAGNLVHVAVCRTPSFLSTWYVPLANTLIVGAALPAVMLAPPAAVAVQVGGVMFAAVSPYEPLGGTRV